MIEAIAPSLNIPRRRLLAGGMVLAGLAAFPAQAATPLDAEDFGVSASGGDQSRGLQSAFDAAAAAGRPLYLPAGRFAARELRVPSGLVLQGVPGATVIVNAGGAPVLATSGAENIVIDGIGFDGAGASDSGSHSGIVALNNATNVHIRSCRFGNTRGNALFLGSVSGRIENCTLAGAGLTGLFAVDSRGLIVTGNTVTDCGNGGIRIFRNASGPDGTIVSENRVSNIRSGSGNGQNGNAINVFRADEVIVVNNHLSDCDFSAVRVNTTHNTLIRGNTCLDCREVAIFSEFAFSGSIISENIIDRSAAGISITNFNDGGRLAVCMGNIVRNVLASSPTNPDVSPIGIFAEADAAITGNLVENVPGVGIGAGWGEHLRDVMISSNVIRETNFGVGVSVAPGAGRARIANNLISGARSKAIGAFRWREAAGTDLALNGAQFANVTVEGNSVS